ncbi:hypothetical protein MMC14_003826 [Varicellaria rhodocarpa]|nr:hypothetical protein [Varicellaria rhodocarpa]
MNTISSDDDDDLEITAVVRRQLKTGKDTLSKRFEGLCHGSSHLSSIGIIELQNASDTASEDDTENDTKEESFPLPIANSENERADWLEEDGEDAYKNFKNRKTVKRKRTAASTRRARAVDKETFVGRKTRKTEDGSGDVIGKVRYDGEASDDELMENTLPDYLQNRRTRFDKRTEILKEAGLKLPPTFEDIEFSDDERLEHVQERPTFPKAQPSAKYQDIQLPYSLGLIPAPIAQWLRDYQVHGTSFLHKMFVYQTGGILGDDMGLGKTVQVIAFLIVAFGKTGDERDIKRMRKMRRQETAWYPRVLVVCPGTLIQNWKSELQRWGWWHVDVYHGETKEGAIQAAATGRLEIMITTYSTYRLNKSAINMVEWDCVIADECHMIKGRRSETTQAMNEINALCRIGLTGTAIQNSYDELWTLLNWTNPGKFGPISTWKKSISDPLKMGQSHDATVYQLSKARKTAKKLVENLLPQFFLRRMKSLIAHQLPKKSDRVVFCPLTETQADAYENFLSSDIVDCIKSSSEPCACGSKKKSGWCCKQFLPNGSKWQSYVFPAISNLQKLANHLAILIPQGTDPMEKQTKDLDMLQVAVPDQWRQLYRNRDSILNFSNPEFCGKWKILKKLLRFWHANGDKVLIFSHAVRLLKMLQMLFNHTAYNVSYLDGAMSYEDRAKAVDDFNSDPAQFVFLISTKAGGVGLNITSANKVVIVDPNWNPSYDLQAQDRAYRIGQIRDVEVFRLVSAGTIEEIVYARQIYKQQQANIGYTASTERRYFKGVQDQKEQKGEIFGLANLFAYAGDNIVLRDIVNKTNIAESKAGVTAVSLSLDETSQSSLDDNDDDENPFITAGDDEDSAMSQLAALVAGEPDAPSKAKRSKIIHPASKKSDPVSAILAGAGVEYTHENSEVVGSSKVEARLSRNAEEAGNDLHMAEAKVFVSTQDLSPPPRHYYEDSDTDDGNREIHYQHRPPQDVLKRQFCSMAKTFGFEDAVAFALVVESWTQAQRRDCLDKFYRKRRSALRK